MVKPLPLKDAMRSIFLNALAYTDGEQAYAAQVLGISPRVMHYRMKSLGIPTARAGWVGGKKPKRVI